MGGRKCNTAIGIQSVFPLDNYVMDVYVDGKDRVWVVDFNPSGEPTCALLFEWAELLEIAKSSNEKLNSHNEVDQMCEFRIIENEGEVLQSSKGSHRGPIDVHAASEFKSFMDICKAQQQNQQDSSGEEEEG